MVAPVVSSVSVSVPGTLVGTVITRVTFAARRVSGTVTVRCSSTACGVTATVYTAASFSSRQESITRDSANWTSATSPSSLVVVPVTIGVCRSGRASSSASVQSRVWSMVPL